MSIKAIELCAGYAGLSLGMEMCGVEFDEILYSEIDAFPIANLVEKIEKGWIPKGPIWTDLKTFPKKEELIKILPHWVEDNKLTIDYLMGGFPCQPFSAAGKRMGTEDPRHLFPYIKEIINEYRPKTVFLENVEGIISAKLKTDEWGDPIGTPVLLHVLRELERIDYDCTFGVFSASEVGAPHQRKRVYIMGKPRLENSESLVNSDSGRLKKQCGTRTIQSKGSQWTTKEIESQLSSGCFWPSRPGQHQHEWEPPRTIGSRKK